jgi:uncharacterized alpha-E superfamily protein
MLSRVADALYWLSRYIERAENVARFVDVNLQLGLDLPEEVLGSQWNAVVCTTGDEALFKEKYGEPTRDNVLRFLTFDRDYQSSIVSCLRMARDNARSVREIISSEMWEQINKAYLMVTAASPKVVMDDPHDFYTEVKQASHLFVGITYLTMTHNEAWHFSRMGRLLERADKTSRIVDVKYYILLPDVTYVGTTYDEIGWAALLKSASALEMYRKRHGHIVPAKVVDFLLLERRFPRSVRYCLTKAERSLHAITGNAVGSAETLAERELGKMHAQFEYAETRQIIKDGLHEYLDDFQVKLNRVGDAIFETFFTMTPDEEPASRRW